MHARSRSLATIRCASQAVRSHMHFLAVLSCARQQEIYAQSSRMRERQRERKLAIASGSQAIQIV
jgi:hypothetical protein